MFDFHIVKLAFFGGLQAVFSPLFCALTFADLSFQLLHVSAKLVLQFSIPLKQGYNQQLRHTCARSERTRGMPDLAAYWRTVCSVVPHSLAMSTTGTPSPYILRILALSMWRRGGNTGFSSADALCLLELCTMLLTILGSG